MYHLKLKEIFSKEEIGYMCRTSTLINDVFFETNLEDLRVEDLRLLSMHVMYFQYPDGVCLKNEPFISQTWTFIVERSKKILNPPSV